MAISNTCCFDDKPIFIDPEDVTEEEWAFLCRIFGENVNPNDCLRFVIESYEVVMKPGKGELISD